LSYKKLEIWKLAAEISVEIHKMTLVELPEYEMYETGRQIRRSSKSTRSNLVEGYGRRYYKQDFKKFIIYSLSSNDETSDHLDTLFETGSLTNKDLYNYLHERLELLGKKTNKFLQSVEKQHEKVLKTNE
jgi:four helix bundle protein